MIPFLKAIADAYASPQAGLPDISRALFVFPNKRSAAFFIKYLSETLPAGTILPATMTISDFVVSLSGRLVDSKIDLLFLLFEIYRDIVDGAPADEARTMPGCEADGSISFDRFRLWGETILNDFNEVDMQLVDVDMIFKNVRDFRNISSNFLTEEQRKVMESYFGYKTATFDPDSFWHSFGDFGPEGLPLKDSKGIKRRFIALWQVLAPLYHALASRLESLGLTTSGGSYRLAAGRLREYGVSIMPDCDRVVFVGFNALTRAERAIFSCLSRVKASGSSHSFAEFFWDASGKLFEGDDNPAARFVSHNRRIFPSPSWADPFLEKAKVSSLPEINVFSVPSNSAQLKIIGADLKELYQKIGDAPFADARVAVVLPDERLLQPLLYSLPVEMGNPNLTMGYPLRQTSVASFVALLRQVLLRRRGNAGNPFFFLRDLRPLLAHPFSRSLFGSSRIGFFLSDVAKTHKIMVSLSELRNLSDSASRIFRYIPAQATAVEVADVVDASILLVDECLAASGGSLLKASLERAHIARYRDILRRLRLSFDKYKVKMTPTTAFLIIDHLISAESVAFEGEPLRGLQIMGMLETRCLDFDYLFIPSLNEKILPRRARMRTFIPDSLRRAYGMPPAHYQEDIFAYYFFRLLSRSAKANLIYDSRVGAADGVTRYILQMDHLLPPGSVSFHNCSFTIAGKLPDSSDVEKSGKIKDILGQYLIPGSGRMLSATSLATYAKCQARFFYEKVLRINTEREPSEAIDPATTGNIIHSAMMQLYLPDPADRRRLLSAPRVIDDRFIRSILDDPATIENCVRRLVNEFHFHFPPDKLDTPLSGSPEHEASMLCRLIRNILIRDLSQAPFRLYGCEVEDHISIPLSDGRSVNFTFAIDRIDRPGTTSDLPLRIVDYKTGYVDLKAGEMGDIVAGGKHGRNILQLFLYADLLQRYVTLKAPTLSHIVAKGISMEIYDVSNILKPDICMPVVGVDKIADYREVEDSFVELLDGMLMEIFDYAVPFRQSASRPDCLMCPLLTLCRR